MSASEQSRVRRVGRGTGLVLAGAVGATAITGIAFAQSSEGDNPTDAATNAADDNSSDDTGSGDTGSGAGERAAPQTAPAHGHGFGGPGTGPVLHGQDTVRTPDGQVVDILIQNGELTEVSSSSITVKSEDGFTATYSITADTKVHLDRAASEAAKLTVGRPVRVIANEDKSAKTVGSTTEAGQAAMSQRRQEMRDNFRQWRQDGTTPDPTGDVPTPKSSSDSA